MSDTEQGGAAEDHTREPDAGTAAGTGNGQGEASAGPDAAPGQSATDEQARLLAEAERRAAEHRDQLLRLQAEMDNLRKRTGREVENAHKFGTERLLSELLPVVDSLELGLDAAGKPEADTASVREGLALTLRMLRAVTEKFGVEVIDPLGEAFNPELHQAMSMREEPGTGSGKVLVVVQKGYRLNGRLIRPAMVIVSR